MFFFKSSDSFGSADLDGDIILHEVMTFLFFFFHFGWVVVHKTPLIYIRFLIRFFSSRLLIICYVIKKCILRVYTFIASSYLTLILPLPQKDNGSYCIYKRFLFCCILLYIIDLCQNSPFMLILGHYLQNIMLLNTHLEALY